MIVRMPRSLIAGLGLLLIAGSQAIAQPYDPFAPQTDFRLVFGGGNMGATTVSGDALQNALYNFSVRNPNGVGDPNIRAWLNRIKRESDRMKGLGGIQATAFIEALNPGLQDREYAGPLDPVEGLPPGQSVKVTGQIQEQVENKDGVLEPGFKLEQDANGNLTGNGHLWVLMVTESRRGAAPKPFAQMFKVVVSDGDFEVETKMPTGDPNYDPNNVFPDFADAAGISINELKADEFEYKLWASGGEIRVKEYWIDKNYGSPNSKWTKYYEGSTPPPPPEVEPILATDPDACIDMMFAEDPREFEDGELPDLAKPPFYCLGRCANPPIVNTK